MKYCENCDCEFWGPGYLCDLCDEDEDDGWIGSFNPPEPEVLTEDDELGGEG